MDASFRNGDVTRRDFLNIASAAAGATIVGQYSSAFGADNSRRPKVAAVMTVFTHRTHAHVLLENFLEPYYFNGKLIKSPVDIVSFYVDQYPSADMARGVAKKYKIPIYDSIDKACCLGGEELAVDAVFCIGEHGNYPVNELGQREYPRKRFFDEAVAVMNRSGRYVPMFNDKHLSYRWDWAREMYCTTQQYGIPYMAGSSVPLSQRRPNLSIPAGAEIEEAVSIHGGPPESYDFHGLEVLQSMVEHRHCGESGVSKVEMLSGDALFKAAEEGRWSMDLAKAAMKAELGKVPESFNQIGSEPAKTPHGLLLTYADGFRATVLKIGHSSVRWNFACRIKNDPKIHATSFYVGPWQNRNLFKALSHAIQHHFMHGEAPYPVERTVLVTGILEAAMRARHEGKAIETPHLEWGYEAKDFTAMREMGATWKIITEDIPEPKGINPNGGK